MKITLNNSNNKEYEALFDDLIQEVFGFSFKPWLKQNLWDERYESYSIIKDNEMLANLCIYKTDMISGGQKLQAIQLGAVCTRKEERGKGLSKLLMEHVMGLYKNTSAYLFANESVIDFYPRFGFKQVQVHEPTIKTKINNDPAKAIKLNPNDPTVKNAIKSRAGNSNIIDCTNTEPIQMFHMLLAYPDDIYMLQNSNALVIAQQNETKLYIADIISSNPVTFEQIKTELPFKDIEKIEFGFCPDWLEVDPMWKPVDMTEVMLFIKGNWNLPKAFRFPATSET